MVLGYKLEDKYIITRKKKSTMLENVYQWLITDKLVTVIHKRSCPSNITLAYQLEINETHTKPKFLIPKAKCKPKN